MKQFKQIPTYSDDTVFEITAKEFQAIEEMAKAYTQYMKIMEGMLVRQLNKGLVKIKYFDLEGQEMSEDEIRQMFMEYANSHNKQIEPEI